MTTWKRSVRLRTHLLVVLLAIGALVIPSLGAAPASADAGIRPGDQLAAGRNASCAILDDLTVSCWGANDEGLLGRGTLSVQESPGPVVGIDDAAAVAVGEGLACAALLDGTVWCWGQGDPNPAPINGIADARALTVGEEHGCAVISDGSVKCWGENSVGQLGNGEVPPSTGGRLIVEVVGFEAATEVLGLGGIVDIDAGNDHTCAVTSGGEVWCWGSNTQLQVGSNVPGAAIVPVEVADLDDAAQVSGGGSHTCAVTTSGAVKCWGNNFGGTLGGGVIDVSTATPVDVAGPVGVIDIAAGLSSSCVLDIEGQRWCWGRNADGEFGNGGFEGAVTPVRVESPAGWTDISAGHNTFCAQSADLTIACWGSNFSGSADGQSSATVALPVRLSSVAPDVFDVGVSNLCVRTPGAGLTCRGTNDDDVLLNGTGRLSGEFVESTGISNVSDVAVGNSIVCVANAGGQVGCWGSDTDGRLGDGPTESTGVGPVMLPGLTAVTRVEARAGRACALQAGDVWCWGDNNRGQVGNGNTTDQDTPVLVNGLPGPATDLATGVNHTCAVSTGEVWCWGSSSSRQLGNDQVGASSVPVKATGISDATAVATGRDHTCALLTGGSVSCWGDGRALGNTSPSGIGVVTPIDGLTDAVAIEGGDYNTCAIRADETVVCWGSSNYGSNGDGTLDITATPVAVVGPSGATALRGDDSMCAAASSGLWCWGRNDAGEAGTLPILLSPERVALPRPPAPAPDPAVIVPAGPARYVDTRSIGETIDDLFEGDGARLGGSTYRIRLADRGDVPVGADAVVVNVTAVRAIGAGYATVHPCLADVPTASSLNYTEGVNLGNEVIAQLDPNGDLCVFVSTETHLTLDVTGYLPFSSPYEPVVPARLVDTRTGNSTIDGDDLGDGAFDDGEIRAYSIAGRGGVEGDAVAAVLNITAIQPSQRTFFTVWPCTADQPTASGLNAVPGVNRANELLVALDDNGDVCVYVKGSAHLAIDVVGQLGDVSSLRSFSPQRFLDTRASGETFDDELVAIGPLGDGETLEVQIAGRGKVPIGATSVVVNVTVAAPTGVGYVTLFPCQDTRPLASSLNYVGGVNGANDVVAQLSSDGKLCAYVFAGTHLVLDVSSVLSA